MPKHENSFTPAYLTRYEQVIDFVGKAANTDCGQVGSLPPVDPALVVTSRKELAALLQADKAELAAYRRK